jgi:hypothetical protein
MDILTHQDMAGKSAEEQAKEAITYVLNRVRSDRSVRKAIGFGTQAFSLLTEAAATLHNQPIGNVREFYASIK